MALNNVQLGYIRPVLTATVPAARWCLFSLQHM